MLRRYKSQGAALPLEKGEMEGDQIAKAGASTRSPAVAGMSKLLALHEPWHPAFVGVTKRGQRDEISILRIVD